MGWIAIEGTRKYLTQAQMENNAVEFNDMALISKLIWNKIDDPVLAHDGVRYY